MATELLEVKSGNKMKETGVRNVLGLFMNSLLPYGFYHPESLEVNWSEVMEEARSREKELYELLATSQKTTQTPGY